MSLSVNIKREFNYDSKTLFNAIGEGVLFKSCKADLNKSNMNFKVGGEYAITWDAATGSDVITKGVFKEINPYENIVFTWDIPQTDGSELVVTTVIIVITEKKGKAVLELTHTGFTTQSQEESHHDGWTRGLKVLDDKI